MGADATGFILAMLVIGASAIAVKSAYYILKIMAAFLWWALGAWWLASPPTAISAGEPVDTIMVVLLFFIGIAFLFMPLWYTRGQEPSGSFRLPFMQTDEEVEAENQRRNMPTRQERTTAYRDRVEAALRGERTRR